MKSMMIEPGQRILVDTNVLLEATDQDRELHRQAVELFQMAPDKGVDLFLATQTLREYLVVATRPTENNGLGMPMADALENLRRFRQRASLVAETLDAAERFLNLAKRSRISGKRLHDLQILATAMTVGMHAIVTANHQDFPDTGELEIIPLAKVTLPP